MIQDFFHKSLARTSSSPLSELSLTRVPDPNQALPSSERCSALSTRSTPSSDDSSHSCTFPIQWNKVTKNGRIFNGLHYRPRHKTLLGTNRRPSWIFDHGADLEDSDGTRVWVCRRCHLTKRYHDGVYQGEGTQHQSEHLWKAHKLSNPNKPAPIERVATEEGTPATYYVAAPFQDLRFKREFVDLVIAEDLSFKQATSERFQTVVCHGGQQAQQILAQSATSVSSWVRSTFESRRQVVKNILLKARSKINISTDVWSSTNRRSYVAICAHFIDQIGKLRVLLIGLPRLVGEHTGENIAYCLLRIFKIYEIEPRIGSFVTDNASNNNTLLRSLAEHLPGLHGKEDRLRCVGHIINLIVKALLFGKGLGKLEKDLLSAGDKETFTRWRQEGPIGKLHNLCVWVNRSDLRRQKFFSGQADSTELDDDPDEDSDPQFHYQLLGDGGVRWNSVYYMIKRGKNALSLLVFPLISLKKLSSFALRLTFSSTDSAPPTTTMMI